MGVNQNTQIPDLYLNIYGEVVCVILYGMGQKNRYLSKLGHNYFQDTNFHIYFVKRWINIKSHRYL